MKHKFISILLTLVLALSLCLVTAVPVAAQVSPQFLDVVAENVDGEWVTTVEATTPQAGTHSYHVVLPADSSSAGLDIIHKYIYGPGDVAGTMTLADITDMTFSEYVVAAGGTNNLGAGITLYMDMNSDGVFEWDTDVQIVLESPYNSSLVMDNLNIWMLRNIDDFAGFQKGGTGLLGLPFTGVDGVTEVNDPLSAWQASDYGSYTVLWVGIVVGWGDYSGYDGYFDDFTINGETYYLDPVSGATDLSATYIAPVIGILVLPSSVDFGDVVPGVATDPEIVTVTNTGDVAVDLSTSITNESPIGVYTGLVIAWIPDPLNVAPSGAADASLVLTVPSGTAAGTYTATLVFWAEIATP